MENLRIGRAGYGKGVLETDDSLNVIDASAE